MDRGMAIVSPSADEQEMTAKPTWNGVRSMKMMANVPKDTGLWKTDDETEDCILKKPGANPVMFLKSWLLTTMEVEI